MTVDVLPPTVESFLRERCGERPSPEQVGRLGQFYADLRDANRQTNLTRIADGDDFWIRHVADSLSVAPILRDWGGGALADLRMADVGCGAGIPMIPLLCMHPQWRIAGIESRGRKVEFVRRELQRLGFANASCVHARAREQARLADWQRRFDVVLLRAVGQAGESLKECRQLLAAKALMVCYKTPDSVRREAATAAREAEKYGFDMLCSEPFDLPDQQGARQFLLFRR